MCGNFGFICTSSPFKNGDLLSDRMINLFFTLAHETEIRGEQAGGGLTLAYNSRRQIVFVGHKIVNPKRKNLTKELELGFRRIRRQALRSGLKSLPTNIIGAWHYRFGTSGPPAVLETHWHEWMPARIQTVWQIENNQWLARQKNINHRITHNGDFDSWQLFGETVDFVSLGLWLERVLHTPNNTVGDSPKIAGMMDLLITQGMWLASVRLAYQQAIARSMAEVFGDHAPSKSALNTAPTLIQLKKWSEIFETSFIEQIGGLSSATDILQIEQQVYLQERISQKLLKNKELADLNENQLKSFVQEAIAAFFYNDVYRATQLFMAQAEGSFGLVITSTLTPDKLILIALGQPITLGFNPQEKCTIYASEPAAVDLALSGQPGAYRLDLDQNAGEIGVIGATELLIYSMTENREISDEELAQRKVLLQENPYLTKSVENLRNQSSDPIAMDLKNIPGIFQKILNTWDDPTSLNRQSAEYFLNFLITKAKYLQSKQRKLAELELDPNLAESRHVDILITGVENSLCLGEQFGKDLKTLFPLLSVKTMSSNMVLQNLQYDFNSLGLVKQSIVFAITRSGQTFPTRQVLHACDLLVRQGVIRDFFILTSEPTSFIGSRLAQPTFPGENFSRRIFTSGSGRNTSEPATASVAATHQTLTELLFYLAHWMQITFPDSQPLGMTFSPADLSVLTEIKEQFIQQNIPDILGTTVTGQVKPSRLHRQLTESGKKWAWHILENPFAWAIQALYVTISIGWLIPFGYTIPFAQTLFKGILWFFHITLTPFLLKVFTSGLVLTDIIIYIFGAWLWTLILRLLQKRQVFARTGKRSLVIGDIPWVHKILENYVSKLFSLSYGITSLEVHGTNPQDYLLHEFAHRVNRGTLLFLGIPDGRFSEKLKCKENAVLMTGKQANGIHHLRTGPEIVTISSNPGLHHPSFSTNIQLPSNLFKNDVRSPEKIPTNNLIENLRESRFSAFSRLLSSYVFFWALAKQVASFPLLQYTYWKSQSRTKIMTTAAPVSATHLDRPEQEEVSILDLASFANREQS